MSEFKCTVCEENGDASACELQTSDIDTVPTHCPWEVENEAEWKEIK
jgi:hypothetical protein